MAFLLLLHQKMRLQRKQNQLTLKQLRFSSLVERMQKKVDKREKYYAKLEKQLERQANAYKNSANMYFSNRFGLGTNSINMQNFMGMSEAAYQVYTSWNGKNPLDNGKTDIPNKTFVDAVMRGLYTQEGDVFYTLGSDGKADKTCNGGKGYSAADYKIAQQIMSCANSQVTNVQTYASQMKSNYENNVSIWLEAQQEQLEAQKEWEMDLLAEEQADMEAEKNSVEAQLELVKQEKQNIEQALGQAIQDSAPKFGLG